MPRKHKKFSCGFCSRQFALDWKRIRHEQCHTSLQPFVCKYCGKGFRESGKTSSHEKRCRTKVPTNRIPTLLDATTAIAGKHTCKNCGQIFERKRTLKEHKKRVHPAIEICECGLKLEKMYMKKHKLRCFVVKARIRSAEQSNQNEVIIVGVEFPCDKCSRSFKLAKLLRDHRRRAHGLRTSRVGHSETSAATPQESPALSPGTRRRHSSSTQICSECGCVVRCVSYRQHMQFHALSRLNTKYLAGFGSASGKVFMCRYITCFLAFASHQELAQHELVHMGPEPYLCGACDRLDADKRSHKSHVKHCKSRHLLSYPCGYCGKFFARTGLLWRHYKSHRPDKTESYSCGHCGQEFPARFELNKHNGDTHQTMKANSKVVVFQCNFCPQKLMSKDKLLDHAKLYHLANIASTSTSTSTSTTELERVDDAETKTAAQEETGDTFNCMYCTKSFTSESRMISHERIHTNEKPHACHICGLAFTFKHTLQRHLRNNCNADDTDGSEDEASTGTDSENSEDVAKEGSDDEVICISSSPSPTPSPSPSPPPSPTLGSVQIQRLDPVPVTSDPTVASGRVITAASSLPSPRDKVYLIQYDQTHQGPLSIAIPNELTSAAIRILPTGQNDPAVPVPVKLERVL